MHQRRSVLHGLQQVGPDGLLQQDSHRPGGLDVLRRHQLALSGGAHHDPSQPGPQVLQRTRQGQGSHHLRGRRDVEAGLLQRPIGGRPSPGRPHPGDDLAQGPIVDVHRAAPGHPLRDQPRGAAPVQMVVHHGRQLVVRRRDGMDVTGQVQVEPFHGHHLAPSAAGAAALDPHRRPQGGLPDGDGGPSPGVCHPLAETHRRRGLALPQRSGRDGGDQDVSGLRAVRQVLDRREVHFADPSAVGFDVLLRQAQLGPDLLDGPQLCLG